MAAQLVRMDEYTYEGSVRKRVLYFCTSQTCAATYPRTFKLWPSTGFLQCEVVPMFRSKAMPPSSEWLNCFTCILTWYRGHQPAINLIKVGGMHVGFPCSVYPYLCTKHIARLVIWKLCDNSQDCAYANRFPVSAEDFLVCISRSCTTCSNMVLGGGGKGEMWAMLHPCIMYWRLPYSYVNHKKPQSEQQKSAGHNPLCRLNAFLWAVCLTSFLAATFT